MTRNDKEIFGVSEVARYLGFSSTKIYRLLKAGDIPATKIGGQYRFSKIAIDRWIGAGTGTAPPAMKTRKCEDWQSRRREFLAERALLDVTRGRKGRPRDPARREILLRLDVARRVAWLGSGRLVRIAPRRYRIDASCAP